MSRPSPAADPPRHDTGPRPAPRMLVMNADDFGLSPGVNRGIVEAHERGILTSASLMVRYAAAAEAAEYARSAPALGLGLHLDLGEWAYEGDAWVTVYEVVPTDDEGAVEREVRRQLDAFVRLAGRPPTHLDSHQHVHLTPPVRGVVGRLAAELSVPTRSLTPGVQHVGSFYGQDGRGRPFPEGITAQALIRLIASQQHPVVEIGCHPGLDPDLRSCYREERSQEVRALCDPAVRAAVARHSVRLTSFADPALRREIISDTPGPG